MAGLKALGRHGVVDYGTVRGRDIQWKDEYSSVAESEGGHAETGNEQGMLMAIILDDIKDKGFACLLSTVTELAQILDPKAPELDNGINLSQLARQCA